jgi:hypothetical protein
MDVKPLIRTSPFKPIIRSESGNNNEVKSVALSNAASPISVIPEGTEYEVLTFFDG